MNRDRMMRSAGWGAVHAVASVVLTFPLVLRMRDHLPIGTEPTSTVAEFNLWTLRWGSEHLVPIGSSYWNAPIFWPQPGAFALSEPQPLTSALYAVARLVVGPIAAYSMVLLIALTLTGVGAALLARQLESEPAPAAIVGVLCQALPFVHHQFGVLQLTMIWPILFVLTFLVAWAREPRSAHAAGCALSLVALALSCGNHTVLFGLSLLLATPVLVRRSWRAAWIERMAGLAIAAGILTVAFALVVIPQQERLDGLTWRRATVVAGSASWSDWWFGGRSWPGIVVIVLAAIGVWLQRHSRTTWFFAVLGASALAISFGPRVSVLGRHPWDALRDAVPAIARLRSPWRATAIVQIALVGLTAPTIRRVWATRLSVGRCGLLIAIAGGITSGTIGPGELVAAGVHRSPAIQELARRDDGRPVALLPFASGPGAATFRPTTIVMNEMLGTGHPLVNGYSGFFPADHATIRDLTGDFPDRRSVDALVALDVRYVIADPAWLSARRGRLSDLGIVVAVDDRQGVLLLLPSSSLTSTLGS